MIESLRDSLTTREMNAIQSLETLVPPSVSANIIPTLPSKKITALLNSIQHHLAAGHRTPVIHFVSAYRGEGADAIALETAYTAAVVFELLDESITYPEQITASTGLPVLATFERAQGARKS